MSMMDRYSKACHYSFSNSLFHFPLLKISCAWLLSFCRLFICQRFRTLCHVHFLHRVLVLPLLCCFWFGFFNNFHCIKNFRQKSSFVTLNEYYIARHLSWKEWDYIPSIFFLSCSSRLSCFKRSLLFFPERVMFAFGFVLQSYIFFTSIWWLRVRQLIDKPEKKVFWRPIKKYHEYLVFLMMWEVVSGSTFNLFFLTFFLTFLFDLSWKSTKLIIWPFGPAYIAKTMGRSSCVMRPHS